MNIENEKLRVEQLINIIEVQSQAKRKIQTLNETLGRCGGLPTISLSLKNRIDTLDRVIFRLGLCYVKILTK
tara:strand:+ start:6087 stop:6302 length:216 start_codon:yes stop_codon:yes gene_type:complete